MEKLNVVIADDNERVLDSLEENIEKLRWMKILNT